LRCSDFEDDLNLPAMRGRTHTGRFTFLIRFLPTDPLGLKWIAFLATALVLTNCCVSGNGCAPVAGSPAAWDGLGTAPADGTQPPGPRKPLRAKREIIVGPLDAAPGVRNKDEQPIGQWEQQQAADQDDEARLKRKLVICHGCAVGQTARDDEAGTNR
jgi:hypothetical protein